MPTAQFNLRENGTTSDGSYNTWRFSKKDQKRLRRGSIVAVRPDQEDPKGKRLDYIFASVGDLDSGNAWVVQSSSVALVDRHEDLHCSLSDHFAVQTTLALHPVPSSSQPPSSPPADPSPSHPMADFDAQIRHVQTRSEKAYPDPATSIGICDEIVPFIESYKARELKQRYWRGVHFYAAVAVWIGCLVAVWFSPANFVAFILLLIGSLGLVAGVIDGLMALLFFSSEIRALKEFEWEVRNTRGLAQRQAGIAFKQDETRSGY
jgi:sphingomyelin phosphodiesterase 2